MEAGQKEKLVELSQISILVKNYNDIFSSFDPRQHADRILSDDFIAETRRVAREKRSGKIELNLIIPASERNSSTEATIKKRLKDYFKRQADEIKKEMRGMMKLGVVFVSSGIVAMFAASLILFMDYDTNLSTHFVVVLLEPAGWFLFWEGLHQLVFKSKQRAKDLDFNTKMYKGDVTFKSI